MHMWSYVYFLCVFLLGITPVLLWIMWVEPQSWATKPSGLARISRVNRQKKSHFQHTKIFKYQHSHSHQNLHFFRILNHWIFSLFSNNGATRPTKSCSPLTDRDPFWQPFTSLPNGNRYLLIGRQSEEEIFIWSAWQVKPLLGNWSLRTEVDRWTSSCFSVSEWRPGGCRVYIYTCICLDLHM